MIRLIFICLVFLLPFLSKAQDAGFQWAHSFGSSTVDEVHGVTVDNEGSTYVVGIFIETIDFDLDGDPLELTPAGASDGYVMKYNSDGNFQWVRGIGGDSFDSGHAVEINSEGDVLIVGSFRNTVDFDLGPDVYEVTAEGNSDAYILKLDSDGNFISVITFGNLSSEILYEIEIDSDDNIYVAGTFSGLTDFNPGIDEFELVSEGEEDVFVLKLDSDGNFIWARSIGGSLEDEVRGLEIEDAENVLLCGDFRGIADFDPGPDAFLLESEGFADGFLLKLDADANFEWCNHIGSFLSEDYSGVISNSDGSLFAVGNFGEEVDFDPSDEILNISPTGSTDFFVQKLNSSGELIWIETFGGTEYSVVNDIKKDSESNLYLTGIFDGTTDFNPAGVIDNLTATTLDLFVHSLTVDGEYRWAKSIGGEGIDKGNELALRSDGSIHLICEFEETADFNPGFEEHLLTSVGARDIAVVKLSPCETNTGTDEITACNSYIWVDGETYTTDNSTATVTLENAEGCDSIITLDLTIIELDNGVTQSGATLTSDDPNANYQWLDCNDAYAEISGEIGVAFTAVEDGTYAVRVEQGDCVDTSECVTIEGVGILQNDLDMISVYPNPSPSSVFIEGLEMGSYDLTIFSVTGEVILQQSISGQEFAELELSQGQYILTLIGGNEIRHIKLVITG